MVVVSHVLIYQAELDEVPIVLDLTAPSMGYSWAITSHPSINPFHHNIVALSPPAESHNPSPGNSKDERPARKPPPNMILNSALNSLGVIDTRKRHIDRRLHTQSLTQRPPAILDIKED